MSTEGSIAAAFHRHSSEEKAVAMRERLVPKNRRVMASCTTRWVTACQAPLLPCA
ncbi:hypothetical protein AAFF27_14725 [Xylophilus sp. GW821-FHT01B05]